MSLIMVFLCLVCLVLTSRHQEARAVIITQRKVIEYKVAECTELQELVTELRRKCSR
jgi:hypothetical protein